MTAQLSREQKERALRDWLAAEAARARNDVNAFIRLCFRNDQADGNPPFEQQWFHREWQEMWLRHRLVVIHGATGFGKTEQVLGHILWRLGHKPSLRVLWLSKRAENAAKPLKKLKRQIEGNEYLRWVFPGLRPGKPWTDDRLRVEGAGIDTTSDTVEVYGLDGSPQGARADIIVADDIVDFENSLTEYQRQKTTAFIDQAIRTRLTTNGQFFMLANAWHEEDVAFDYSKRAGVCYGRYPAENDLGELLWPQFRDKAWLEAERETMPLASYERMYLCRPRSDATRIFQSAWFALAKQRGAGLRPVWRIEHALTRDGMLRDPSQLPLLATAVLGEMRVVIGVDLATGKTQRRRRGDFTVLFIVGVHPSGLRQVLWVERGRWSADVTLERLRSCERRYQPERIFVEDNGAQVYLAQLAPGAGIETPIDTFTTTEAKWDESLGIEGIGTEMRAGLWALPGPAAGENERDYLERLGAEEREALANIRQAAAHLLDFSRVGHTPDDVMAWWFAACAVRHLAGGLFAHTNAASMPMPPLEQQRAAVLSPTHALEQLFPPSAGGDDDPQPPLPAHLRQLLGP